MGRELVTGAVVAGAFGVLEDLAERGRRETLRILALFGTHRAGDAAMAMADLHGVLRSITDALALLRRDAVAWDAFASVDRIESLGELVLRAELIVIERQIDALVDAIEVDRDAPWPDDGLKALFVGRFGNITDVAAFVKATLHRVETWTVHRRAVALRDGTTPDASRALHRRALGDAHAALAEMGADPDFAHLLRAGVVRADWREVRQACETLAVTLGVELRVRMPRPMRSAEANGANQS